VTTSPTAEELERFRSVVAARTGLAFDDAKLGFLGEVLQRRLDALHWPAALYLQRLEQGVADEVAVLAGALTVGETYFFRNREQFRALAEVVLPARQQAQGATRTLRLLSAGCASGEEPYTMAIVARETVPDPGWSIEVRAVDINPGALDKARRATYAAWALRETPEDERRRWFRQEGRDYVLAPAIREAVRFEARNLADPDPELWRPSSYDVIFCRNVLMYFDPPQAEAVVRRIERSLMPGGFLFLGHAETLRGLSDSFHLRHTHETFYYERKGGEPRPRPERIPARAPVDAFTPPPSSDWVEVIRAATERVASLTPRAAPPPAPLSPTRPAPDLAPAFDLLRRERFDDALAHVAGLSAGGTGDRDLLLVEAALLVHGGRFGEAGRTARRLLEVDDLSAGAHYVLALCAEQGGALDEAAEHDRIAIYLDPGFAMPRLHRGLLAKRSGDRDTAKRELTQAQLLLRREDASRLLLFGGGFGREALMALCDSALRDREAAP
jgi:chemotaxis protein methyltransferase CheR